MSEAAMNGATPQNAGQPIAPGSQVIVKPTGAAVVPPVPAPESPKPPEADSRLKELEAQTKRFAQQQRKFSEERQAVEKRAAELEAKSKEYEEWKQYHADRLRNPAKYLEKDYGSEWYDKLTAVKLNGAPTGDLIASEMDSRLSEFEKKLQAREAEVNKRFEEIQEHERQRAIETFHGEIVSEVKKNLDKYPGIEAFAEDPTVWASLRAEIDGHFHQNQQAILNGEMEMLTAEQAASNVNKRIEAIGQKFEAARNKKQPPATPTTASITTPQRRTLSTDMTASSGGAYVPPKDDKERLERAKAAMEAARRK